MGKKQYVYKIVPVEEIYLSDYEDDVENNGRPVDDSLKVQSKEDDTLDVYATILTIREERDLRVLIMLLLGYRPGEMVKILGFKKPAEAYNIIQRLRSQFKRLNK